MWVLPLAEAFNAVDAARESGIDYEELRAVVTLGAGKERRSRRSPARASDLPKVFGFTP